MGTISVDDSRGVAINKSLFGGKAIVKIVYDDGNANWAETVMAEMGGMEAPLNVQGGEPGSPFAGLLRDLTAYFAEKGVNAKQAALIVRRYVQPMRINDWEAQECRRRGTDWPTSRSDAAPALRAAMAEIVAYSVRVTGTPARLY